MTNNKPITSRLADALRLGIAFMEGFEDDEMQETVTDDLKTMRDALTAYEATPSLGCYRALWEIDIEANNPREAAELALAIHRDPTSIATFFSVVAPDGMVSHHDLDESNAAPPPPVPASVEAAAPVMLAALRRVAEDFDDTGCEDCGVISLDTLAAILHALQVAGVPVEIETK